MTDDRGGLPLGRLSVPLAFACVAGAAVAFADGGVERAPRLFVAASIAAVLAALALVPSRRSAVIGLAALAASPMVVLLSPGRPLELAAVFGLLSVTIAIVAGGGCDRAAAEHPFRYWLPTVWAAQSAAWGWLAWSAPNEVRTWLMVGAAPLAAGSAIATLARRDVARAQRLALALFAAGPGFGAAECALLGFATLAWTGPAAAAVPWLLPIAGALPALAHGRSALALATAAALAAAELAPARRLGRVALAGLAFVALLLAAPPWLRAAPLRTLAAALRDRPFSDVLELQGEGSILVAPGRPGGVWKFEPTRVAGVLVASSGTNIEPLACGTPLAEVRLLSHGIQRFVATISVGSGGGDWAALRPDVAGRIACPPAPDQVWVAPQGRAIGSTFTATLRPSSPVEADELRIDPAPNLPPEAAINVSRAGLER